MEKSPLGAVGRSAVLPGWGQYYNESYWKIPIFWGAAGWFVYGWTFSNKEYKYYQTLFNESLNDINSGDGRYKKLRDFYRDQRDLFAFYFGLAYLINLIDAYVDAHLFDFDVSENPFTHYPQFNLRIKL